MSNEKLRSNAWTAMQVAIKFIFRSGVENIVFENNFSRSVKGKDYGNF